MYYRPVPTRAEDLELMALMDRQYLKTPFYGSRKMKAWLLQQGYLVSRKRVRRLMRLMGLEAIYRRPNTSKPAPGHRIFPYLLKGVEVNRVDQVWAADITYIPMAKGFLYLVAIMDWHSRHVLAWKLSNTMDASFCVAALEEALGKGRPEIFNTDQGSQFTSEAFTQTLQEQRVQVSMDGKGRYLDNIFVERRWRSIKYEEVYLKAYQTVAEARTGINAYLEFYNRQRPHQALGYRTPAEVYQHGQEERGAAAEEAGLPWGLVKPSAGVGDSLTLAPCCLNNGVHLRRMAVVRLASQYGRYGYRRVSAMLQWEGWRVNHKRVDCVWRRGGLKVYQPNSPSVVDSGLLTAPVWRLRPQRRNHVWAYDFVALRTSDGKPVRLLTVVDEYTRECLAIHVGRSLRSPHVIECLGASWSSVAVPERLRSDNGPEFTARAVRLWLPPLGATTLLITPGSPWENGYVESFDGKLRTNSWTGSSSIPSGRCRSSPSSGATSTTTNAPTAPWAIALLLQRPSSPPLL